MKVQHLKMIIGGLIFLVGLWGNLHFSTTLHRLLLSEMNQLAWIPVVDCLQSMRDSKVHQQLFLLFQGFITLVAIYYVLLNHKPYESNLIEITPAIKTPVSAGQHQFGSARWMSKKEKEEAFSHYLLDITGSAKLTKGGVILGSTKEGVMDKFYYNQEDTHSLCIGATRSGKTRSIVLQTLGTLALAKESMVVSDPKGELQAYTTPFLESLGYEVIQLDFKHPLKSDRYNFLQPIIDAVDDKDLPRAIEATWDLTASLVPEENHNEKIWSHGEASIIASAIMAVVYDNRHGKNRRFQNLTNVYFFISEMCKVNDGIMPLTKYIKDMKSKHPAKSLLSISEVAPSKTRGSFFTSALTTLRLFTNPLIHQMTNISDMPLESFGDKKQAIFIILPDEKTTYYSLASLFVNQCYMALVKNADSRGGRLKRRVNLILDEFGNFVQIPDFGNKLTVGGGRGIRFNLYLQSFLQLDEKYGKDLAGIIKSNCETWIYLQADDLTTLEEVSKKLGNYTVSTYSLTANHARYTTPSSSHSVNLTSRALLTIDEVGLIKRPYVLVMTRNHPVVMEASDIGACHFNELYGMGDMEHNRKIREERENARSERQVPGDMDTWNIWDYYSHKGTRTLSYEEFMKGENHEMERK